MLPVSYTHLASDVGRTDLGTSGPDQECFHRSGLPVHVRGTGGGLPDGKG